MPPPASPPPAVAPPPATPPAAVAPPPTAPPAEAVDARALASRALTRELQGDHAGAIEDLKAALEKETDPERRQGIQNLLRLLDGS